MSGVGAGHLVALYRESDDPWNFRSSAYERAKFEATAAALPRARYASALEVGCGNGELARRLARRCDAYRGIDAVDRAIDAARIAVPRGRFDQLFLPARLPDGDFDLIVLSEILYFLDAGGIADLANQIDGRWPRSDVVCVTWLGPSGNPMEGEDALAAYLNAARRAPQTCIRTAQYRIDVTEGTM